MSTPLAQVLAEPRHDVPRAAGLIGMILFLASLTMLFVAGLLGYVLIRLNGAQAPTLGTLTMPAGLWVSSLLIIISSATIQGSLQAVRHEHQHHFRRLLIITLLLTAGFLAIQIPCLWALLADHFTMSQTGMRLYGMVFFMIIVHAAHVLGGVIPLCVITANALRGRYDHEHHQPVRYTVMYWHFLDVVWIVLFATMWSLG